MDDDITLNNDELQTAVAAIGYYLYRQAGCPYGNTDTGLQGWMGRIRNEFEDLAYKTLLDGLDSGVSDDAFRRIAIDPDELRKLTADQRLDYVREFTAQLLDDENND